MTDIHLHRKIRTALVAPLLLVLLVGLLSGACGGGEEEAHPGEPATVQAVTMTAERVDVPETVEVYGTVEADRLTTVSTRVMATVTGVHVVAGQPVEKGELLFSLDPQVSQGQVSQARGGLAQARSALTLAERNYQRFQELAKTNAASELELDQARMHYEQALGAVEQAQGAVSSASSMASDARVTAPFAGRVARRMVEMGDLAAPGRPLLVLESESARRLAVAIPESVVASTGLSVGSPVDVSIDSRPDLGLLAGIVTEMTPGADPMSHRYDAKIDLTAPELPTGAAGRAFLPMGTRPAVTVPAGAVLQHGGLTLVVVEDAQGRARTRVVTTGRRLAGDRVEVLSGLAGGETVLVDLPAVPPLGALVEARPAPTRLSGQVEDAGAEGVAE